MSTTRFLKLILTSWLAQREAFAGMLKTVSQISKRIELEKSTDLLLDFLGKFKKKSKFQLSEDFNFPALIGTGE